MTTLAGALWPALHQLLHSDAQGANHQCLITQFEQGSIPGAAGTFNLLPERPTGFTTVLHSASELRRALYYRLSPSRAPPSLLLSAVVVG